MSPPSIQIKGTATRRPQITQTASTTSRDAKFNVRLPDTMGSRRPSRNNNDIMEQQQDSLYEFQPNSQSMYKDLKTGYGTQDPLQSSRNSNVILNLPSSAGDQAQNSSQDKNVHKVIAEKPTLPLTEDKSDSEADFGM